MLLFQYVCDVLSKSTYKAKCLFSKSKCFALVVCFYAVIRDHTFCTARNKYLIPRETTHLSEPYVGYIPRKIRNLGSDS